jgi:ribokinase
MIRRGFDLWPSLDPPQSAFKFQPMLAQPQSTEVLVCGLATIDIVVRPIALDQPIGAGRLHSIEHLAVTTGGLVSNSGIALCRLGIQTAAIAPIGDDPSAETVRDHYRREGLDDRGLIVRPRTATATTLVLVDRSGQRSFLFHSGAGAELTAADLDRQAASFGTAGWMLIGYYSLFPQFDRQLPEILVQAKARGQKTALDCAGTGGSGADLRAILPLLDVYVPSVDEASHQTGQTEVDGILSQYREWGAKGVVGLKLGASGAVLSPPDGGLIRIPPIRPPGPIVDTTGAGDAFYAGLIAGIVRGKSLEESGRIAASAGAACVSGLGATGGLLDWQGTCALAGVRT